ncbi:MAG: Fe-S cluster assembly protein SufD [Rhodospirillaceae bacterium]|jgi:Fe-S cluster assembly protein SufD|nr:Fe-S cluster assembly protein SufD [Rhodospirillaceae bacterium]MBT6116593.1 Fe-S cluster assembly protein SufD [Rhodospirillaceae bacterium]
MAQATDITQAYADQFARLRATLPGAADPKLAALREGALARFARAGVPTPRLEDWKYTRLGALLDAAFEPAPPVANGIGHDAIDALSPALAGGPRLVFVNGLLRADLCRLDGLPDGMRVESLGAAPADLAEALADRDADALWSLNVALARDGAVVTVAKDTAEGDPLHIVHLARPEAEGEASHTRHLIRIEPGAAATVVESYFGPDGATYWNNGACLARVGRDARLRHFRRQQEGAAGLHRTAVRVELDAGAAYESFGLFMGGALGRDEISVRFAGEGASCTLDGIYLGRGTQHLDCTTRVDHAVPHCTSHETYRGVLDDKAHGVFQGLIRVEEQAQKTDAHMLSKTLLLSDRAAVDTKPELEILADDVQCSHGATTGDLDPAALFFLRSRGLPEALARAMLVEAFITQMVEGIGPDAVRADFAAAASAWSGGESGGAKAGGSA